MPWFWGGRYRDDLVTAILAQRRRFDEVIVIDDSPYDPQSRLFVKALLAGGQPARLIEHAANLGLSVAHHTALEAADTDWLTVLPQDDLIVSTFGRRLASLVSRRSKLVAVSFAAQIHGGSASMHNSYIIPLGNESLSQPILLSKLFTTNLLSAPGMSFRVRSTRPDYWSAGNHSCQDWESWLYFVSTGTVLADARPMVRYRPTAQSLSQLTAADVSVDWRLAVQRYSESEVYRELLGRLGAENPEMADFIRLNLEQALATSCTTAGRKEPPARGARNDLRRRLLEVAPIRVRKALTGWRIKRALGARLG